MSPPFTLSRTEKMKLTTSRMSLSLASHVRESDISQDSSNAYNGAGVVPCCVIKELRPLGDITGNLPYCHGCPQCRKAAKSNGTCPGHGKVTAVQDVGAAVVLQDPCATLETILWKEAFEPLRSEF